MTRRPNILLIMDDQHRHDFLGCAGGNFVSTPHIDGLADRGVRFTQCTTNAPVCAPARIGLATAMQPTHFGALDNNSHLPIDALTYYKRLRDVEYKVAVVGKLDLAKPFPKNGIGGDRPKVFSFGFTHPLECEGKMHAGSFPYPFGPYTQFLAENGLLELFYTDYQARAKTDWVKDASHDSPLPEFAFEDAFIGSKAVEWLEKINDDDPWHLFVSFVGPHDPYDPPESFARMYRNASVPEPISEADGIPEYMRARRLHLSSEETQKICRQYCGSISLIDAQIGKILDVLEKRDMIDNTVIIFVSDHGEMMGDHGLFRKHTAYESSMRIPLIVSGPGIARGGINNELVELIDINPTICEFAGLPTQQNIDGVSLVPMLKGLTQKHRDSAVTGERQYRAIRTKTYKLIENYNDILELYDLESDPQELKNIAAEQPEVVKQLQKKMNIRYMRRPDYFTIK